MFGSCSFDTISHWRDGTPGQSSIRICATQRRTGSGGHSEIHPYPASSDLTRISPELVQISCPYVLFDRSMRFRGCVPVSRRFREISAPASLRKNEEIEENCSLEVSLFGPSLQAFCEPVSVCIRYTPRRPRNPDILSAKIQSPPNLVRISHRVHTNAYEILEARRSVGAPRKWTNGRRNQKALEHALRTGCCRE